MKAIYKLIALAMLITALTNCRPKKDETPTPIIPPPPCWAKFVGNYIVHDTANNVIYTMSIAHKDTLQSSGSKIDSLIITNYGNKFNFRVGFLCQSNANVLDFGAGFPAYDHNNKRWAFWVNTDDTTTARIENELKNDTIILYFNINNIAFYYNDGVPYYSKNLKHIAIKQH